MTREPLRTVVVGFGQVADTLGEDSRMARYFGHASHAEVLAAHPAFAWDAVVDPSDEALQRARRKWGIQHTAKDFSGLDGYTPEIAVIAAPPAVRRDVIESFDSLRGVLVEKPLGTSISEAEAFVSTCRASELAVQVHFWRRAVPGFQELAKGSDRRGAVRVRDLWSRSLQQRQPSDRLRRHAAGRHRGGPRDRAGTHGGGSGDEW